MYSKATVAGHPIHPMLIGFPVTCYVATLTGYAVYVANGHVFWLNLGIAASIVGAGTAVMAAVPGMVDLGFGLPRVSAGRPVGIAHAALNLTAAGLMAAAAYAYAPNFNGPLVDGTLGLALSAAAVTLTIPAGFLGWMLVQDYHIGIRLTPRQADDEPTVQAHHVVVPLRRHHAA